VSNNRALTSPSQPIAFLRVTDKGIVSGAGSLSDIWANQRWEEDDSPTSAFFCEVVFPLVSHNRVVLDGAPGMIATDKPSVVAQQATRWVEGNLLNEDQQNADTKRSPITVVTVTTETEHAPGGVEAERIGLRRLVSMYGDREAGQIAWAVLDRGVCVRGMAANENVHRIFFSPDRSTLKAQAIVLFEDFDDPDFSAIS
jgi:hypothetical protein